MPNWCYNTATLSNDSKEVIDAFEAELQKEDNQPLNYLRPNPAGEWDYGWSVDNWGTKWDVSISDYEREDDHSITVHFDSAWAPPIALYAYLSDNGWYVNAKYHEPGMGFIGRFEDGDDDYYDYDLSRESIESLPEELIDYGNLMYELEEREAEAFEELISDLDRTDWFDKKIKPFHVGRYEVQTKAWPYPQYCNWDGKSWSRWEGDEIKVTQWRGLANEYQEWDAVAELDKILNEA